MKNEKKQVLVFIGSYADLNSSGLYSGNYDTVTGSIELLDQAEGLKNPTFLTVDEEDLRLYAISEVMNDMNQSCGAATGFNIDPLNGKLALINSEITIPAPTCHITLDQTNQIILVSSYHGGMIGVSPLLNNGRIGSVSDFKQHKGSSILPVQGQARAHSIFIDRSNRFIGVCDLGLDQIILYRLDLQTHSLQPHSMVQVAPGSGPRHFDFHPTLSYGYVINELNSTVTAFSYDEDHGVLSEMQTLSTLPSSFEGDNACADIHISPDGKFLYGSNRGHNSIVVYRIDPISGKLTFIEHAPTLGEHPRNFAISPDGNYMLVANKDSNNIVTLSRNATTGALIPSGNILKVSKPVCIKFVVID